MSKKPQESVPLDFSASNTSPTRCTSQNISFLPNNGQNMAHPTLPGESNESKHDGQENETNIQQKSKSLFLSKDSTPSKSSSSTSRSNPYPIQFHHVDPTVKKKRKVVKVTKEDVEKLYYNHSVEDACKILGITFEKLRVSFVDLFCCLAFID